MKFDAKVLQREMDLAAEELERAGYLDLAARVDQYNAMLLTAKKEDLASLHRGLSRIQVEYEQRAKQDQKQEVRPEAAKAQHAVLQARRASIKRKLAMRRFLREKMAQKKQAGKKVDVRKAATVETSMQKKLAEKVVEAEKTLAVAKNRIERLKRIQDNLK
jgi:hypothetical protein